MNPLKNKPNINVSLINNSPINCLENYREPPLYHGMVLFAGFRHLTLIFGCFSFTYIINFIISLLIFSLWGALIPIIPFIYTHDYIAYSLLSGSPFTPLCYLI